MKKFFSGLVVLSMGTVFAQILPTPNPVPFVFEGTVPQQCSVTTPQGGDLTFTNGGTTFETSYTGTGTFTYQTNTNCRGELTAELTINDEAAASSFLPTCRFGNQTSTVEVEYTPAPTPSAITISYEGGTTPLPAGDYEAKCLLEVSAF